MPVLYTVGLAYPTAWRVNGIGKVPRVVPRALGEVSVTSVGSVFHPGPKALRNMVMLGKAIWSPVRARR